MYLKANGQILQTGLDKKNIRFQINRNLCPYSDLEMVKKRKNCFYICLQNFCDDNNRQWQEKLYASKRKCFAREFLG